MKSRVNRIRMFARSYRGDSGITLMELVLVVVVLGVIFGLTLPLTSGLAGRFRVGSARDVFVNYHARARAGAVQFGRQGRLHIDAGNGVFWVEVDTGVPGATGTDTLGQILNFRNEFGGVTMSSNRGVLCFDSRGLPFTGGATCDPPDATVVFEQSDRADTVRISLGGTVIQR